MDPLVHEFYGTMVLAISESFSACQPAGIARTDMRGHFFFSANASKLPFHRAVLICLVYIQTLLS